MRPVTRPGVYYAAVGDGAYLLTPEGGIRLTGAGMVEWLDRLLPHLDGQRTLAELTAGLSPEQHDMVTGLVTALRDRGVVRAASEPPVTVDAAPGDPYAAERAFLAYFCDRPAEAFARFRATPTLVLGEGPGVPALARAAVASGIQLVRIATDGAAAHQRWRHAAAGWVRDPQQRLEWCDRAGAALPADLLADIGLVLHAASDSAAVTTVESSCVAASVPLGQIVGDTDAVWTVPPDLSGGSDPDGRSLVRRIGAVGTQVSSEVVTVAAAALVQAALRAFTGAGRGDEQPRVTRIAADLRRSDRRAFAAHRSDTARPWTRAGFHARILELAGAPALSEEEFSRRAAGLADERLGVFRFRERGAAQLPLNVAEAEVIDPADEGESLTVHGCGFGFRTARCATALQALARYGVRAVDRRQLVDGDRVFGVELGAAGQVRLVPVPAVFPGPGAAAVTAPLPPGVAAGYSWREVVTAGLLDHFRDRAIVALRRGDASLRPVDLATVALDEAGLRCRDLLAALDELPQAYQISDPVPTLVLCQGAIVVACVTATSRDAALSKGLQHALLAAQSRIFGQGWYAPPPVAQLPEPPRAATPIDAPETLEVWDVEAVVTRLRAVGKVPVAVPLDHDPRLTQTLPFLVRVVVCDD